MQAASATGLPPRLLAKVVEAESSGNPNATSSAGAMGLMQLMPETAKMLGVKNPYDPAQNLNGGARYLRQLLERYHGNLAMALAAYNWGPGNVEKYGVENLPPETRAYVTKIVNGYVGRG